MAGVKPLRVLNSTKQFLALKNFNFSKAPFYLRLNENNAKGSILFYFVNIIYKQFKKYFFFSIELSTKTFIYPNFGEK